MFLVWILSSYLFDVIDGDNWIELCLRWIIGENVFVGTYCNRGWQLHIHCVAMVGM